MRRSSSFLYKELLECAAPCPPTLRKRECQFILRNSSGVTPTAFLKIVMK